MLKLTQDRKVITKIVQQKNKKRYSIYINDQYYMGVSENVLVNHNLRKGMIVSLAVLNDIVYEEEQSKANHYALRLLSFRGRSEREIISKMQEKEYNDNTIKNTLSFLKSYKYIDDNSFASDYIRSKIRTKKYGKIKVKQDLMQKGVSKDIINSKVEELTSFDQEYQSALDISMKKLETTYKNDDHQAQYRKLGAFLQRRGFEYEVISKILNKLVK